MSAKSRERRDKWAKVQEARSIEGAKQHARFYDVLRTYKDWRYNGVDAMELFHPYTESLERYVVVDAQPIYNYYDEQYYGHDFMNRSRQLEETWQNDVNAKPPYDDMFFEFAELDEDGNTFGVLTQKYTHDNRDEFFTIRIVAFEVETTTIPELYEPLGDPTDENSPDYESELEAWEDYEPDIHPRYVADVVVNADGTIRHIVKTKTVFTEDVPNYPTATVHRTEGDGKFTVITVPIEFDKRVYVALMSLTLMNCRNITDVDITPSLQETEVYQRHFGVPLTKYKTLAIKSMSKRTDSDKPQQQFDVMPLHLRRGNFAHYTEDAPLFGKFTGTFWRPATVVGSEKNGVVVKDYKVLAPET